jgi:hypothetical protein
MIKTLKKHWLLALLIVYALWRCGIPVYVDWDKFHGDGIKNFVGPETIYLELAEALHDRGEYTAGPNRKPYGIRTPGYSLIIAGFISVFESNWAAALAIFQAVCIVFACVMIYIAGTGLRSPPVGALAGFLVATYAPYHNISCGLLREPICLALFAMIMLLLLKRFYHKWSFIAMGLLIGVTSMIREEFLLLTLPCIAAIWLGEFGGWVQIKNNIKAKWRKPLLKSLGVVALIMLVFSPWIIRNAIVFKRFQMTGTLGGIQLYLGNNPTIRPDEYSYNYGFIVNVPEMRTHNDYEVGIMYRQRAIKFMLGNPDKVIVNSLGKAVIAFENSVANVNDFPVIFIGIFMGVLLGAHFKLSHGKIMLNTAATVLAIYIFWRGGFYIGLLLPNIEFGWIFRILGLLGFFYLIYRREELPIIAVFPILFMVNIIFVPQHRHRWITDWLFMLWISILLRDSAVYAINKQKNRKNRLAENV